MEIKCNLIDLVDAISFLHSDVKIAHLGIGPSSIYVTEDGRWLLGGFVHNLQLIKESEGPPSFNFYNSGPEKCRIIPDLRFSAPETTKNTAKASFNSDVFSLGALILTMYKMWKTNSLVE